jgi:hypothetical protein
MDRCILIAFVCLLLVSLAFAHGGEEHVLGTVRNISDFSITVETAAKKTVEVAVTDKTTFEKSGQPSTLHDLKIGDRVVIHAGKSENKLTAHTVKFGSATSTARQSHAKSK